MSIPLKTRSDIKLQIKLTETKIKELEQKYESTRSPETLEELEAQQKYLKTLKEQYEQFTNDPTLKGKVKTKTYNITIHEEDKGSRSAGILGFLGSLSIAFAFLMIAFWAQMDDIPTYLQNALLKNTIHEKTLNAFSTAYTNNALYFYVLLGVGGFFFLLSMIMDLKTHNLKEAILNLTFFSYPSILLVVILLEREFILKVIIDYQIYLGLFIIGLVSLVILVILFTNFKEIFQLYVFTNIFGNLMLVFSFISYYLLIRDQNVTQQLIYSHIWLLTSLFAISYILNSLASFIYLLQKK